MDAARWITLIALTLFLMEGFTLSVFPTQFKEFLLQTDPRHAADGAGRNRDRREPDRRHPGELRFSLAANVAVSNRGTQRSAGLSTKPEAEARAAGSYAESPAAGQS